MNEVEKIIDNKNWNIDAETKNRLSSLIQKFIPEYSKKLVLLDILQFSSYFVTHVYKLVCEDNGKAINFYAKFAYLPKEFEKRQRERIKYEYDCTVSIYNVFQSKEKFDSVNAVAFYEEESVFVMQEMQGKRLDELLLSSMKPFSSHNKDYLYQTMHSAGEWLRIFQNSMPVVGETVFSREVLEARVLSYFDKVNALDSSIITTTLKQKLISQCKKAIANFSQEDLMITAKHNDYAPWNLMADDSTIIGFDYADVEYDSIYYDVYHFTRALNSFKLKPIKNAKVIEACKQHFLNGYGLDIPMDHPTRIYFNIFFSLERLQMLLRAKKRNSGFVGKLKTLSQKRHFRLYLSELNRIANL